MPSVLLAEDDDSIRTMNSFALTQAGFEVTMAPSGGEALERAKERQFDIILLDMMMAGMSGLDFLRNYDVRVECPQTKVIALSAIDNPKIVAEAKELGVFEYLNKADMEPAGLVAHLKEVLAAGSGAPGTPAAVPDAK
jgi:CheY-like chemotaxis protein